MKLTQAFVKRATCKEGTNKQEFYDDELKGFKVKKGVRHHFKEKKGCQAPF